MPQEVTDGWLFISLAFGGVVVNLVGVLFFWFPGEDGQSHDTHCGGFLAAHSHSHDHGCVPACCVFFIVSVDRVNVNGLTYEETPVSVRLHKENPLSLGPREGTSWGRQAALRTKDRN